MGRIIRSRPAGALVGTAPTALHAVCRISAQSRPSGCRVCDGRSRARYGCPHGAGVEPRAGRRAAARLGAGAAARRRRARRRRARDVGRRSRGDRRAASRPASRRRSPFEANRASTEASILGFAQILEHGADPAATSLGAATLAYTQGRRAARHPADDLDPQLPARARRRVGTGHAADRRARGRPGAASDRDRALLSVAVRVRRRGAAACRGLLQRRARALGAEHAATRAETIETILAGDADRRRAGESTPRLRARPSAHRGDRLAAGTRRGTRHSRRRWRPRSHRSAIVSGPRARWSSRSASCRSPPGSALATPSRPASWMTSGSTRTPRPGFGSRSANPGTASPAFARATTRPSQARRVAELAARPPAPSPATRASRSPRSRPPTSTRPARSSRASSTGLLPATTISPPGSPPPLRTYLDEHSSRSRTAKRLGIHENTVSYRIKQAEEILGRSVDQRTLELRVALALAHLVRETHSAGRFVATAQSRTGALVRKRRAGAAGANVACGHRSPRPGDPSRHEATHSPTSPCWRRRCARLRGARRPPRQSPPPTPTSDYDTGLALGAQAYQYGVPLLDTERIFKSSTSVTRLQPRRPATGR